MVNFDEVDREIAQWQSALAAASDNLITLYEHPTYKRLDNRTIPLTGATATLVTPALAAMNELFAQMGQLTDAVDRAARLRQSVGRFAWSDRTVKEIQSLLRGPSIQLPPVSTPLEQRGLLTSAEQTQAIIPERLLAAMTQAFEEAKSAVLAVDTAWARLDPMLAAWDMKLSSLVAMAKNLGDDAATQVSDVQQQLQGYRNVASTDPISATSNSGISGQLQASLERLRLHLEALALERAQLKSRLVKAQGTVAAIVDGRVRAAAAEVKCRQCIETPRLLGSITETQMTELSDWLSNLKECEQLGHWSALGKGLERWEQTAQEYAEAQQAAVSANEGFLETLAELNGRLSALKFKMRARGLGGKPAVVQAERLASDCLCRPKVALDQAARLVAEYENQVSAGAATKS